MTPFLLRYFTLRFTFKWANVLSLVLADDAPIQKTGGPVCRPLERSLPVYSLTSLPIIFTDNNLIWIQAWETCGFHTRPKWDVNIISSGQTTTLLSPFFRMTHELGRRRGGRGILCLTLVGVGALLPDQSFLVRRNSLSADPSCPKERMGVPSCLSYCITSWDRDPLWTGRQTNTIENIIFSPTTYVVGKEHFIWYPSNEIKLTKFRASSYFQKKKPTWFLSFQNIVFFWKILHRTYDCSMEIKRRQFHCSYNKGKNTFQCNKN